METKKLYRSDKNKMIAGVLGGIGEYLNIDPVIFRLAWIIFFVFVMIASELFIGIFSSLFAYFLAIIIIPKKDSLKIEK